ncbi:hypothetical protein [Fastidiosibacter lacustris]|uniref:hypothetical protein n=1 Tax=Fastidiosibacter lacustris TaxID=2056695 RepID=UPI000E352BCB|nr:hypothetical protein [Fastidiosibacter lacustris]
MQSTISTYDQLNQATLAEMRRLGLTADQAPVIDQPKNPFDFERPDMIKIDQTNQKVNEQSQVVLNEKNKMANDVQHNVDRGLISITKEYRDLHNKERTEEKDKMLKNPMLPPSLQ